MITMIGNWFSTLNAVRNPSLQTDQLRDKDFVRRLVSTVATFETLRVSLCHFKSGRLLFACATFLCVFCVHYA